MIYQCIKPWTTPKRDKNGRKTSDMRDIPLFTYWECDVQADRLNGDFLLRRVNSITRTVVKPTDFVTIPAPLFYSCLEPIHMGKQKLWECEKDFSIDQYDDNGNPTGDNVTVHKGSIWKMDTTGSTYLSADIHLDDPYGQEWIELSIEKFHLHFQPYREELIDGNN